VQAVTQHLIGHLGDTHRRVAQSGPISVYAWPDPDGDPDVSVLVTVGMSALTQAAPPPGRCLVKEPRTELFALAPKEHELAMAHVLADLAHYPERHSSWLHWFHNLPLGDTLIPGSTLSAVFTDVPYMGAHFATISRDHGRIDILWVIPITDTERTYLKTYGFRRLLGTLRQRRPLPYRFLPFIHRRSRGRLTRRCSRLASLAAELQG